MFAIKHLFHIDAPQAAVYKAISTVDGLASWWTVQTSGVSNIDDYLEFRFGDRWCNKMKVVQLDGEKYVEWECIEGAADWIGTRLTFYLDRNEEKTRVRFTHSGFRDDGDFFSICNSTWARYMRSLKDHCQTNEGAPFGSPNYKP